MAYTNNIPSNTIRNTSEDSIQTSETKLSLNNITTSSFDSLSLDNVQSKIIDKTFGRPEDYVELHIYNRNDEILRSEYNFTDYIIPKEGLISPITNNIQIDPNRILNERGFFTGQYLIKLNILKRKIFNTNSYPFAIKEISSDRTEIKSVSLNTTNKTLDPAVSEFISDIESSVYFKEFSINFGDDKLIPAINILLNKNPLKHEILFKTLFSLPIEIQNQSKFKIVEEIINPLIIAVDLGNASIIDDSISLSTPNFNIDIRQNNSVPSGFKSYDDLLSYNVTSSYQYLLNKLEKNEIDLNIEYDYIRPVSESNIEETYHFENFTHFSSATERLKNFKYKLELIESYDSQIETINLIPGSTSSSIFISNNKKDIYAKKEKLIKGLDGYEQFLYFDSGTYAWPKINSSEPYYLLSVTSSEAQIWLGDERSSYSNYGGQLLSSSLFDNQNPHNLSKLIPNFISDNSNNNLYVGFVNMIGQHFDNIWSYIKAISSIYDHNNIKGISKDLVYYQLKSLGIETFDQFENADLIEYLLGHGKFDNSVEGLAIEDYIVGGNPLGFYDTLHTSASAANETLITASNAGSIPKGDISKEIWKRLYHNATYLLKTKGTERGIRALMSCYGIPSTILNIKEYGGSALEKGIYKDLDTANIYKTFTYEKASLALKGRTEINPFIASHWSSSLTDVLSSSAKTVEFRIKPTRQDSNDSYRLFSINNGSFENTSNVTSSLKLFLTTYTGADISSSEDSNQYGKLSLYKGVSNTPLGETANFPIYNGDFWNIFIGTTGNSGSNSFTRFGAYQSNFNKNISFYTASISQLEGERAITWGDPYSGSLNRGGAMSVCFGGARNSTAESDIHVSPSSLSTSRGYSGSLQEIRFHFHPSGSFEMLSHETFKKHALEPFMYAGNTPSSSFNELVLRLPLGSNDQEDSSSFHPNIDTDYYGINTNGGFVSSSMDTQEWEEVIENHHLLTPDTVGISTTSEKVRIDNGTIEDNILSPFKKLETSTLDRQPQDFPDLGIFFSPTEEINEDIIYTLGGFRLDDYIGNPLPSAQSSSFYNDLKDIKDIYFKKVKRRFNYWDYIKQIQYIDHTLFKMIEQFVPFKANLKTGLLIEPHFLERTKIPRGGFPNRSDGQTMTTGSHQTFEVEVSTEYDGNKLYKIASSSDANTVGGQWDPGSYVINNNNLSPTTSSRGKRLEQGTNTTIFIYDDYLDPTDTDPNRENQQACQAPIKPFSGSKSLNYIAHESSVLLGNVIGGRKSNKYYKYKDYFLTTSSLY